MNRSTYPVHVEGHLDPNLSRGLWLVKWLLALPHFIVLAFLWLAVLALSVVAFFAILFTGRYPRGIFDFNVGVLRWGWRVAFYSYGALGTDRYPPFSLHDDPEYPARLEVDYPEQLSRGLVLVKWWLLAIPQYLLVSIFVSGLVFTAPNLDGVTSDPAAWGVGLISLLVAIAGFALLFTGRYPRSIFDLVVGLNRWVFRVVAYAGLMTDEYPPFRLDQGPTEPVAPSDGETAASAAPVTASPSAVAAGGHGWNAGRVVALVVGCVLGVGALGTGLAGGALVFVDTQLRDDAGFLMSREQTFTTDTYALTSTVLRVDAPAGTTLPHRLIGDGKVTATSNGDAPVFVGIATESDVSSFLGDTQHATIVNLAEKPAYRTSGSSAPAMLPGDSDIWMAQSSGTGTQEVTWPVEQGDWRLVVMNADGARGVTVDVSAGATAPVVDWLGPTLLVIGGVVLLLAVVVIALSIPTRPRTSAA